MNQKKIAIVGVVALLAVAGIALLRYGISRLPGALLSTRFPPVTWSSEPVQGIPAENQETLNGMWNSFLDLIEDPKISESLIEVGTLVLPTGSILATDLNFVEDNLPFRRQVVPGNYPVFVARTAKGNVAVVLFMPRQTPTVWVVADAFGDDPADSKNPNGLWGISVDSSAILVDAMVCTKQSSFDPWPIISQETSSVVVDPKTGVNVVCVNLGGVGVYKAYWALDESGQAIALVATDF